MHRTAQVSLASKKDRRKLEVQVPLRDAGWVMPVCPDLTLAGKARLNAKLVDNLGLRKLLTVVRFYECGGASAVAKGASEAPSWSRASAWASLFKEKRGHVLKLDCGVSTLYLMAPHQLWKDADQQGGSVEARPPKRARVKVVVPPCGDTPAPRNLPARVDCIAPPHLPLPAAGGWTLLREETGATSDAFMWPHATPVPYCGGGIYQEKDARKGGKKARKVVSRVTRGVLRP